MPKKKTAKKKPIKRKKKVAVPAGRQVKKKKKRPVKRKTKSVKRKMKKIIKNVKGPKVIGEIEHFFGKIFVVALKLKTPLKVGDVIHIKGVTTDFTQKIESMQIDHQNIDFAKRGQDVGFRVRSKCRVGDTIYLAPAEKTIVSQPVISQPQVKTMAKPQTKPQDKPAQKSTPYGGTKFLSF